jgi:isopentenyl phosphate kinase
MKKLILIKIGGGVITDKSVHYGLREDVLVRLAKEIGEAQKNLNDTQIIIGNGAGSFAHFSAHKYRTTEGFVSDESRIGMGWVRHDAVKLNQIVFEQLLLANVPVFSFSPSSLMSVKNGKTKKVFMDSITDAMEKQVIPLVYGDVVVDSEKGCDVYSTEKVFDELAIYFAKKYQVRVIHISSEEGVYKKGQASVFSEINKGNFAEVKEHLGGSHGVDVSGGMLHKVEECIEIAKLGITSQIVSGMVAGRVREAILGKKVKGTTIK